MSKTANRRKRRPQEKPAYTRLNNYNTIRNIVKESSKKILESIEIVNLYNLADKGRFTTGELLSCADAVKAMVNDAPAIKERHSHLESELARIVALPGKRKEEDFSELLPDAIEFIQQFVMVFVQPIVVISEAIERATAPTKKVEENV